MRRRMAKERRLANGEWRMVRVWAPAASQPGRRSAVRCRPWPLKNFESVDLASASQAARFSHSPFAIRHSPLS